LWYSFAVRILVDYRPALRERTGVGEFVHELVRALAGQAERDRNDLSALAKLGERTKEILGRATTYTRAWH